MRVTVDRRIEPRPAAAGQDPGSAFSTCRLSRRDRETLDRRLHAILDIDAGARYLEAAELQRPGELACRRRGPLSGDWRGCRRCRRRAGRLGATSCIRLTEPSVFSQHWALSPSSESPSIWRCSPAGPPRHSRAPDAGTSIQSLSTPCARSARPDTPSVGSCRSQLAAARRARRCSWPDMIDQAGAHSEGQRIAQEFGDVGRLQRADREIPLRGDARGEFKAARSSRSARSPRSAPRAKARRPAGVVLKSLSVKATGWNSLRIGHAARAILVAEVPVADHERLDPQRGQSGFLGLPGRWRGRLRRQVGKIDDPVRPDHRVHAGRFHGERLEHVGAMPERGEFEIHEKSPEREHRRAVGVREGEVADLELQLEGLHPHRADLELAPVGLGGRT